MACRIPGCSTKYWHKNNKIAMFTADPVNHQIWREILSKECGIKDFRQDDRICILHFEESAIERTKTIYHRGGLSEEVTFTKPKLAFGAYPTVFSFPKKEKEEEEEKDKEKEETREIPRQKKNLCYTVIKDTRILAKQRQIFKDSLKDNMMKKSKKRKLESKNIIPEIKKNVISQGIKVIDISNLLKREN